MTTYLRYRYPGKHAIWSDPDKGGSGLHEVPDPAAQYTEDHPLVRSARWAFGTEDEIALEQNAARNVREVPQPVEQATAGPGEKRNVIRRPTRS
jgi:hypothetical protein